MMLSDPLFEEDQTAKRLQKKTEATKKRIFIEPNQTLNDALRHIVPNYTTLYDQIMELSKYTVQLPTQLKQKCHDSFVMKHNDHVLNPDKNLSDFRCFENLLEDCISFMIHCSKHNYVECAGIEFKDYALKHQALNFSKSIMQKSFLKELFKFVKQRLLYEIICNYTIIIRYRNDYVQVGGRPLNIDFNNFLNEKRKKIQTSGNRALPSDPYEFSIKRSLIFYCSHINRSSGMFHRNIFFDEGISISTSKQQLKIIMTKVNQQFRNSLKHLKAEYLIRFQKHLEELFVNMRRIFNLRVFKGKKRCYFQCMLKNLCPLPPKYKQLKKNVFHSIKINKESCDKLFDDLYTCASDYSHVVRLLRRLLKQIVPEEMIGKQNLEQLKKMIKEFVNMKRYQNLRMEDYLHQMDVFKIPWLDLQFNRKFKNQIIRRGQKVLAEIIGFILNDIVIPLIKFHFYVTEQHKEANRIFYYRKPIWILVAKLALFKFSQQNLRKLNHKQLEIKRMSSQHFPEGKLRILPKKGTFRPIITFNKKMKVQKNSSSKQTLQKILGNTQLVLRNMKNNLWEQLGFSVFDNRQIRKKMDSFIKKWRLQGCPKLSYFTLDIKKCYDSINTTKLREIIEKTPFIEHFYFIKKYHRLYRNKRPLIGCHNIGSFFNMKDRIAASPLSKDPLIVNQNDSIPAFTIFSTRQKSITKEKVLQNLRQLCQGSIINYKKQCWSQNYGIPQGLNVSGVLCSLYFGTLENKFVRPFVKKGLLMRLTDDYLYLGYQDEAKQVLSSLMKCANQNQFKFSDAKMSKNFYHKDHPQIDQKEYIVWIGKRIDFRTLEMEPYFQKNEKIQYAMNVNLKRSNIKGFMKNKLKSLLTNHFDSYFKPQLFPIQTNISTIKIFIEISLQKFFPFLKKYSILHLPNPQLQMLEIIQGTFHDYILYICMLMKRPDKATYLLIKKNVVQEVMYFFRKRKSQKQFRFILLSYQKKFQQIERLMKNYVQQKEDIVI